LSLDLEESVSSEGRNKGWAHSSDNLETLDIAVYARENVMHYMSFRYLQGSFEACIGARLIVLPSGLHFEGIYEVASSSCKSYKLFPIQFHNCRANSILSSLYKLLSFAVYLVAGFDFAERGTGVPQSKAGEATAVVGVSSRGFAVNCRRSGTTEDRRFVGLLR
jgi:hypothetical protein